MQSLRNGNDRESIRDINGGEELAVSTLNLVADKLMESSEEAEIKDVYIPEYYKRSNDTHEAEGGGEYEG